MVEQDFASTWTAIEEVSSKVGELATDVQNVWGSVDDSSVDPATLTTPAAVDAANLNEELARQPALFSRWAVLAVEARAERDKLEEALKVVDAQLDAEFRQEAVETGEKVTEKKLFSKILLDSRHTQAMENCLEARSTADIIQVGAREAFSQRKDCLISLAANLREEFDAELYIKEKKAQEIIRKSKEGK